MAVDLSDLVDSLKREVNAPGIDQLPGATDADYLGNLQDGFWEAKLEGIIFDFTESDGIVTPISGSDDISRDIQQLIIFYAGYRIVRNQLRNLNTLFRAKSGPNEFETQQAATLLYAVLKDLEKKRALLLVGLSELTSTKAINIDGILDRMTSQTYGDTFWVRG